MIFGKTRKEEELESKVAKQREQINGMEKHISNLESEYDIKEKKAVAALENKYEREKLELEKKYEKRIQEAKEEAMREKDDFMKRHLEEHYNKLQSSLQKLHEEGNVTTQTVKEFGLAALNNMKHSHKQVTHKGEDE